MRRTTEASIAFAVVNAADAGLTAWALASGYGEVREANPLMALLIAWAGLWGFAAVKTTLGVVLAWQMARRRSSTAWVGLALVVGVMLWNTRRLAMP